MRMIETWSDLTELTAMVHFHSTDNTTSWNNSNKSHSLHITTFIKVDMLKEKRNDFEAKMSDYIWCCRVQVYLK